ncbi:MAG: hypothetical protein K8R31_08640 [Bacteroidales bacterium]|nr:hypothetical protein [Bacteroidales bacterium]
MPEITLTKEQLQKIQEDMFKTEEMLTDAEINAIAQKVNKSVNLPLINENKEFVVYVKIIKWIDRRLYQLLPNEYYKLVKSTTDGISAKEAELIEKRITPLINNFVNIPVLTEKQEGKLIGLVLGIIIKAMIKGFKLEQKEPKN